MWNARVEWINYHILTLLNICSDYYPKDFYSGLISWVIFELNCIWILFRKYRQRLVYRPSWPYRAKNCVQSLMTKPFRWSWFASLRIKFKFNLHTCSEENFCQNLNQNYIVLFFYCCLLECLFNSLSVTTLSSY